MARFKMGNKSVVTQSGDDEPVVASNVVYGGNVTGTISSSASGQNRPYFFCSEYESTVLVAR